MPSQKRLRELFDYVPTGNVTRKIRPGNRCNMSAWKVDKSHGYTKIRAEGHSTYLHRLIWAYHNGPIPKGMYLDHIDGDRGNNRIENLRVVDGTGNGANKRMQSNNTTGYTGVWKQGPRFIANVWFRRKKFHLGSYLTPQLAYAAVLKKQAELGIFTERHGLKDEEPRIAA